MEGGQRLLGAYSPGQPLMASVRDSGPSAQCDVVAERD